MPIPMNQLFNQIHKLPQVPEVVRCIINQLNNPNADMLDIAKNVEKEQVITLKILRLVNSAHFGLSRKVGSIHEAITMLGMNQLKTLVVASGIVSAVPQLENFDVKQSWRNSFRTAGYAKWFATEAGLAGADIAYTAGLMSNLGNILIHIGSPREANEIDQHVKNGNPRLEIEKRRLGYTSQAICAELCRRWKFADELIETIEHSAEPLLADLPNKLACTVFLAHSMSDYQDQGMDESQIIASLSGGVTDLLGLDEPLLTEKLPEVLATKSELEGLLE